MSETKRHDPLCPLGTKDTTHQSWGFVDCRCNEYAEVRAQIAAEIEAFRVALPEETPSHYGTTRNRDDMSWALAKVRDRVARLKEVPDE